MQPPPIDPRERLVYHRFSGEEALYRDHLARRVVADVEGAGEYDVNCSQVVRVEADLQQVASSAGSFGDSLVCTMDVPGDVTVRVRRSKPVGQLQTVNVPYSGSGWLVQAEGPVAVDGRQLAPEVSAEYAQPFFIGLDGAGSVGVIPASQEAVLSDSFRIEDEAGLKRRGWRVQNISALRNLRSTDFAGTEHEMAVASHLNAAHWTSPIHPRNQGVILRKRYDRFHGRQRARVFIDGQFAGWWYEPAEDRQVRWGVSDFGLPPELSVGKEQILVTIDPPAGSPLWSVAQIELYSLVSV